MTEDRDFDIFKKGTPFQVEERVGPSDLKIREVKVPETQGGDGVKEVKVLLQKTLAGAFPDLVGEFDMIDTFKASGPPNLIQVSQEYGVLFYALGQCLFAFQAKELHDLVSGDHAENSIKNKVLFKIKFDGVLRYLKLTREILVINFKDKVQIFKTENLIRRPNTPHLHAFTIPNLAPPSFVRQICCHPRMQKLLLTTSDQRLHEFDMSTSGVKTSSSTNFRSAIYNQQGTHILALQAGESHHITVFEALDDQKGAIQLSFPQEVNRDYYRCYYMTEFEEGTSFIYSAFFKDDGDKEANLGTTIIFIVKSDVGPSTTMAALRGSIQYYYSDDFAHMNDDDDDGCLPIIR